MDKPTLLLRTLDDLANRVVSHDPYEVLGIALLIRKLLLDASPLVDQVNAAYRLKVTFAIADEGPLPAFLPQPDFWSLTDGLDPEIYPPGAPIAVINVYRDALFARVVNQLNGTNYTVKDVIDLEAHVMGGVHAGSAAGKQIALETLNNSVELGGMNPTLRQLCSIGRIVLRGLQPLQQEILASRA